MGLEGAGYPLGDDVRSYVEILEFGVTPVVADHEGVLFNDSLKQELAVSYPSLSDTAHRCQIQV